MTTRELAKAIIVAKGWDTADKVLREDVTYRLVQALTIAWRRKALHSPGKAGNARLYGRWGVGPQPRQNKTLRPHGAAPIAPFI